MSNINREDLPQKLWTADYVRILILNFLVGCTIFIQVGTLPEYILGMGGTMATVGLSMGLFSFSALLTRPLAGFLLDWIGRVKVLTLGCILLILSLFLYMVIKSFPLFFILRCLNGIAFSLVSTTAMTLIVDVTHQSRLRAGIGYYAVFGTLATAVGPAVGMFILLYGNFTHLFLGNLLIGIIVLANGAYLCFNGIGDLFRAKAGKDRENQPLTPVMFAPAILVVFLGLSLGLILTYVPVLGIERNLTNISLFFSSYAISIVGVRLSGTKILERIRPFTTYILAILFQCAALLLLAGSSSLVPVLTSAVFFGTAFAIVQPLLNFMQLQALPPQRKGMAGAIYYFALDMGFAAGSAGFGFLLERTSFIHVFILCSIIVFSSIFFFTKIALAIEY